MKTLFVSAIRRKIFLIIAISMALLGVFFVHTEYTRSKQEIQSHYNKRLQEKKNLVREHVNQAITYINFQRDYANARLRSQLKLKIQEAWNMANNLYKRNKFRSTDEIEAVVHDALHAIRWFKGRGYYFVIGIDDGLMKVHANNPSLEGSDATKLVDPEGVWLVKDFIRICKKEGEGFSSYLWKKLPTDKVHYRKLSYVKLFQPLGWIIGTGEYLNDIEQDTKELTGRYLSHYRIHNKDEYLFALSGEGRVIFHGAEQSQVGSIKLGLQDTNGVRFIEEMIKKSGRPSGGYVRYRYPKPGERSPSPKLTYVRQFAPWGWTIAVGTYLNELEAELHHKKQAHYRKLVIMVGAVVLFMAIFLLFAALMARKIAGNLSQDITTFLDFFREAESGDPIDIGKLQYEEFHQMGRSANAMVAAREEALLDILRFKQAVESSSDAIGMSTVDKVHYYQNKAFTKLFGFERPEDLQELGGGLALYRDPEVGREVFQTILNGKPWRGEVAMKSADGHELSILLRAYAITDDDGKVRAIMGMHTDVTEAAQARSQLQEANRLLKEEKDRANELAKHAEAANRAKSEFLANMSHEIRTPMNGVIGMTGLLLDTKLTEKQRHYADLTYASAESLLTIINDILDFSKIEARKLEIEEVAFDLRDMIEEFSDSVALRAEEQGLEYHAYINKDVPLEITTDIGRVRQILTNLTGNALKFTSSGEITLVISLQSQNETGAMLRFEVKDTGIGIAAKKLSMLFSPFVQADGSTTRRFGGTGLGLSICRQLTNLMGGEIGVESEEGSGSTFWFTLPVTKTKHLRAISTNYQELPAPALANRYLILDSHPLCRRLLHDYLSSWGFEHTETTSPDEALVLLRRGIEKKRPYFALFMGRGVTTSDGTALSLAIKNDPRLASTHLILLSSPGTLLGKTTGDRQFSATLTRPVKYKTLFKVLHAIITGANPAKSKLVRNLSTDAKNRYTRYKFRVLVVEDNIVNQKVAMGILSNLGLRVDVTANGKEALAALRKMPYDLVFMDCQMPVMDGFAATEHLRKEAGFSENQGIPVIAMTANAMKGDRENCIAAGMSDYIPKPVTPKALITIVEKWLSPKIEHARGAASEHTSEPFNIHEFEPFLPKRLISRMMGDEQLASLVLESFINDFPNHVEALWTSLSSADFTSMESQIFSLKGASSDIPSPMLKRAIDNLSIAVDQFGPKEIEHALNDLELAFQKLITNILNWKSA